MKTKDFLKESNIKISLVLSFVFIITGIIIRLTEDTFLYWGIKEDILGIEEVSIWEIIIYHLTLLISIIILILFEKKPVRQWFLLIFVFGMFGYFIFNSGSCITKEGIYERKWGETVFHPFYEVVSYQKNHKNERKESYTLRLKNGQSFTFDKKVVDKILLQKAGKDGFLIAKEETLFKRKNSMNSTFLFVYHQKVK
jgi:hypothetical protein